MRGGDRYNAGRPGWRRKCEHMLSIDVRQLHRKGRLAAGQSYNWHWSRGDEPAGSMGISTFAEAIHLTYTWTPRDHAPIPITCRVHLTRMPCTYGGVRTWFLCPDCGRVCAVLYGPTRRGDFACRVCERLVYSSEAESPTDRCWRAQRKLEARLTGSGRRPAGMHRRTYKRIYERLGAIEERKDGLLLPMLLRLVGDRKW